MPPAQVDTLKLFLRLQDVQRSWAGALLVGVGLNGVGRALALASLAAGAAGLFLENDPEHLRLARRASCCTFSVSSLGEAIRILKNEIRQGRAVAVSVSATPLDSLGEMVERGLQPQAIALARPASVQECDYKDILVSRGALVFAGDWLSGSSDNIDLGSDSIRHKDTSWRIGLDAAPTMTERREQDRALLQELWNMPKKQGDKMRDEATRWLRVAPSLFPRALDRAFLVPASN